MKLHYAKNGNIILQPESPGEGALIGELFACIEPDCVPNATLHTDGGLEIDTPKYSDMIEIEIPD